MSVIHHTTLVPTKVELLTGWLPKQPWYAARADGPDLARVGGFRLDDPADAVGLEFMAVADGPTTYFVPLSYRGAPLDGADDALLGTAEHGVLGRRWIYDGSRDPVLVAQLVALIQGDAEPQAQRESNTPDPTVSAHPATAGPLTVSGFETVDTASGTELRVATGGGTLTVRLNRVLSAAPADESVPGVVATWHRADGSPVRASYATASYQAA
ncbi:hypothetical protein Athai_63510 [Actinocatenispora thailandica]|uniref:Maltokinase N-terminal cap domain-containing protein n=1 Tax=Actinocatenispora thailandica TaxID=227318 RepID=A0A7R7DVW7_9ACTN|nr:hypothetical protein [Actinocatenispora thailandica]BCJ38848.1 hypothetical protein Athai_63510 [Actinocatenispora thailandica]